MSLSGSIYRKAFKAFGSREGVGLGSFAHRLEKSFTPIGSNVPYGLMRLANIMSQLSLVIKYVAFFTSGFCNNKAFIW